MNKITDSDAGLPEGYAPRHGGGGEGGKLATPVRDTNDPRYKKMAAWNEKQKADKIRRDTYTEQLKELQNSNYELLQANLAAGAIPQPIVMLTDMIQRQQLVIASLKPNSQVYNKEMKLLLDMYDRYTRMTGTDAPRSQQIDLNTTDSAPTTPDEVEDKFKKFAAKNAVVIDHLEDEDDDDAE